MKQWVEFKRFLFDERSLFILHEKLPPKFIVKKLAYWYEIRVLGIPIKADLIISYGIRFVQRFLERLF